MKLISAEWYKLFIKRHFALLLIVLLLYEMGSFCLSLEKRSTLDAESTEVYHSYMKEYGGELTEENVQRIEKAINERLDKEELKKKLHQQFLNGEISVDAYREENARLQEETKGNAGFNAFVTAYENSLYDNAYLADATVWDVLLGTGGIDFVLALALILMVIAVTVYDDETGINKLRFSTKNGKAALISVQLGTVFSLSLLIPLFIFAGKFLIAKLFFRLDGFDNPLHAAEAFSYTPLKISLLKTYILLSLIKTVGFLYLSLLTMLIGQICKSSLYTTFISLLTIGVPAYVLANTQMKYLIPVPSSLLTAGGYFYMTETGSLTLAEDMQTTMIKEFSPMRLPIFFTSVGVILLLLILSNRLLWTKRRSA